MFSFFVFLSYNFFLSLISNTFNRAADCIKVIIDTGENRWYAIWSSTFCHVGLVQGAL